MAEMTAPDFNALSLAQISEKAWELLGEGAARTASPFHTPALATLDSSGPQIRTVVLRQADCDDAALVVHTDRRSPKYRQLEAAAQVAVLFYDTPRKLQLRVNGMASLHVDDALADARWRASRHSSRQCYRLAHPPGERLQRQPIGAAPLIKGSGRDNFAVIRIAVTDLDWLYLQATGHRRAHFEYIDGAWHGAWLAP
jgi:hypothetical protein